MTASSQNFTSYAGMAVAPIFTVTDGSGNAIDLSTASDIEWIAFKDITLTAALTKKKSVSAGVTFVNTGSDGNIQVNMANGDSTSLDGWYFHSVVVTDSGGNKTTVAIGRMAILQPGPL